MLSAVLVAMGRQTQYRSHSPSNALKVLVTYSVVMLYCRETHDYHKTVCLLGIRADESLQRYSGIVNKKYGYNGECSV